MSAQTGAAAAKKDRYKVHRGEPGKGAVIPLEGGQPIMAGLHPGRPCPRLCFLPEMRLLTIVRA